MGVGLKQELGVGLAKIVDDGLYLPPLLGILDAVQVDIVLVCVIVEDVAGLDGLRASLFVAKDQVYPLMKVGRHILRLLRNIKNNNVC